MFIYTVEQFLATNRLWRIREVAQTSDNTYVIADTEGRTTAKSCSPASLEDTIRDLIPMVGVDDWVDILYLNGTRDRNIQGGVLWTKIKSS